MHSNRNFPLNWNDDWERVVADLKITAEIDEFCVEQNVFDTINIANFNL